MNRILNLSLNDRRLQKIQAYLEKLLIFTPVEIPITIPPHATANVNKIKNNFITEAKTIAINILRMENKISEPIIELIKAKTELSNAENQLKILKNTLVNSNTAKSFNILKKQDINIHNTLESERRKLLEAEKKLELINAEYTNAQKIFLILKG
jgi:hypothetical protein